MKKRHTRRDFLKNTAKAAVAFTIVPRYVLGGKGYIGPHGGHKKLAVGILGDVPDFLPYFRQVFAFHRQTANGHGCHFSGCLAQP